MLGNLINADSAKWYPILFDTPHNTVRSLFIWITLFFIIAFLIAFFLLKEKPAWKNVKKYGFLFAIFYAAAVLVTLLTFTMKEDGIVNILFIPILVLILLVAASAGLILLFPGRKTNIVSGSLIFAGIVAVLICIGIHFSSGKAAEINGLDNSDVNSLMLYVLAAILIVFLFLITLFFGQKSSGAFTTKSIAYAAICVGLSFALSFLTLVKMPQGGSVTLVSLLPLMFYSQMFGVRKGVIVGFIYGVLQAIQSPWILHPAQFLLDYPIAFSMIGLTSIFTQGGIKGKKGVLFFALGAIVAVILRFISHFIAGVFAFASYASYYGYTNGVIYSLAYNSFAFVDMGIALAVGVLMLLNSAFVKVINRVTYSVSPSSSKEEKTAEQISE